MTTYNDFIRDFPDRCGAVLGLAYDLAKDNNREVTLLIMAATAALLLPFERLRGGMLVEHQAKDRERFPELAKRLDSALGKPFLESVFYGAHSGSWSMGTVQSIEEKLKDLQESPLATQPLPPETPASEVLALIRNALAHGNVWTRGGDANQIDGIVFWSENRKIPGEYKYICTSPNGFHGLLVKWLEFLNPPSDIVLKLQNFYSPLGVVAETLATI
jgi:hypothetical protein